MARSLRPRGELEPNAFGPTINAIVQPHGNLRTHFIEVKGEPAQVIEPSLRIPVPIEDLSELDASAQQHRVATATQRELDLPFDLSRGPLLRLKLLKLNEGDYVLLRTFHHIVSDGWSETVFSREFMALYEAFNGGFEDPLPRLPFQYADFALWQRHCIDEKAMERLVGYWKEQLAGIPEELTLPKDRPRGPRQTFAGNRCVVIVPAEAVSALGRLSLQSHATMYMTLLAAYAVLLQRYSGKDDVVLGSPVDTRQGQNLDH